MKKVELKKIVLRKESVRALQAAVLEQIAGGLDASAFCPRVQGG